MPGQYEDPPHRVCWAPAWNPWSSRGTSCPIRAALWPKGDRMEPTSAGQGEERFTPQGVPVWVSMTQGVCVRERRQRDAQRQG